MDASAESLSTNSIKHRSCFTSRLMKESSSRGYTRGFHGILAKTHVKMLKKYRVLNGKVRASDDEFVKCSHDVPRDSSSSCLKFRISF